MMAQSSQTQTQIKGMLKALSMCLPKMLAFFFVSLWVFFSFVRLFVCLQRHIFTNNENLCQTFVHQSELHPKSFLKFNKQFQKLTRAVIHFKKFV